MSASCLCLEIARLDVSFFSHSKQGHHHDGGAMPTVCMLLQFEEHSEIRALM
jgi:hypothetical protein